MVMDLTWIASLVATLSVPLPASAPAPPELPVGPPPKVAYGFSENRTFQGGDWELVRADGSRQPLPSPPYQLVVHDDFLVNGTGTEGGFDVDVVDRAGRVVRRDHGLCAFGLATNADHSLTGWLHGRTLVTIDGAGRLERRRVAVPPIECGRLVPVALDRSRMFLDGSLRNDPYVLGPGRHPYALESLRRISDVTRHRVLGLRARPSHCSAMVTLRGVRRWQTCDHRLLDAAPDGRHVLGIVGTELRTRAVSIFTRNGRLVTEWAHPAGSRIDGVGWEDAGHVLAVVDDARGWSVVRLGVDGSAEYAVAPVAVPHDYSPFRLPLS
jgi:hypothetical protein